MLLCATCFILMLQQGGGRRGSGQSVPAVQCVLLPRGGAAVTSMFIYLKSQVTQQKTLNASHHLE